MRRVRSGNLAVLWLAGVVAVASPAMAAKPAREPDPFPRAERRAAAEVRRHLEAGHYGEADSLARELIARAEAGKGPGAHLPDALDLRAEVLWRWALPGDLDFNAVSARALEARGSAGEPDPVRLAAALEMLGIAKLRRAEYTPADSLFARAVALLDSAAPAEGRAKAVALAWQAEGQRVVKKLKFSQETAASALAALERDAPDDTTAAARVHSTLGNTLGEMGQTEEAIAELERAILLESSRGRPDSALVAGMIRFLGRAETVADRHDRAIALYERAAAMQERALGPDHSELAATLYLLAYSQSQGGNFLAARRSAERAVKIRERTFGPDHLTVATALWQVGAATRELGDAEGAVAIYERSVEILRRVSPPSPADLATGLGNLGATRLVAGDGRRAREALDESVAIRERVFGPGAGRSFWTMSRLGQALLLEGRSREAEALFDTLLAGPTRRSAFDVADVYERLGAAAYTDSAFAKANTCFDRAFAFHDSVFGIASPRTLESLSLRAAGRWAVGRREDALADARRYERAELDFVRSAARGLSEREALDFEGARAAGRDILIALAADSSGLPPEGRAELLDAVVRSRLAVLDELADEARALPRHDAALAPLVRELESSRAARAAALVGALREARAPDSVAHAARARREAAERALAERSGSFRAVTRRASAGAAEVAAALPPGSALISYVRYHSPRRILEVGTPAEWTTPTAQYAALLLRAGDRTPAVITLGAAVELEPMVDRWLAALATPPPATAPGAAAAQRRCDAIGRAIRSQLWDPVARHLAGATRVFVVPDGVVHRVNFIALPDTLGVYLAESGPLIHRLTAERDLLPWTDAVRGSGLLALGGADFERAGEVSEPLLASGAPVATGGITVRSAIPDSLRVRFGSLPETAGEVAEVGRLWRAGGSGDALELIGAAASEAAFKRLASGKRVLHLATHGFALGAPAGPAARGTRGIGGVGNGERPAAKRVAALLPGLALAGANAAPGAGEEDGFLTSEEITSLELSGADWAVLSACETGLSDPDAVEAVQGLHRSFRRAGVRTVIVSLWAVDDAATRAWMKALYAERVGKKTDTATAVRAASRARLSERRAAGLDTHPFHWAAFVAAGDWR